MSSTSTTYMHGKPSRSERGKLPLAVGLVFFFLTAAGAWGAAVPQANVNANPPPTDASTASTTDPQQIVQRLVEREPDLQSYKAHVHVKIRMRSFPFLAPVLNGETYFKRPGKYEVVFDRVPFYAKGFDRIYADIGDPSNWDQRFLVSYSGQVTVGNHSDIVLKLVQRVRGMIDHELVMVDPASWHIDQMQWYYYNGGTIKMTQQYSNENGFDVVVGQSAEIKIPHVSAVAQAQLSDFATNVAIDDGRFAR